MPSDAELIKLEEEQLCVIAASLDEDLQELYGRRMGFVLLSFEFDKPCVANYTSNCTQSIYNWSV